jgi:hypothetical protein
MKKTTTIKTLSNLFLLLLIGVIVSCTGGEKATESDEMETEVISEEPADEWVVLFDGKSLDGWKRYNADEIGPLWTVEDGMIKCDGTGLGEGSGDMGGSLVSIDQFGNFELEIEWKISEGGNSGIMYHVIEKPEYGHAYETGPEYQVLDDTGWTGGDLTESQKAGSNYDMFAAPESKKLNPALEWNTTKIRYEDGKVTHWLNDEITAEFDESSDDYQERYEKSKWVDHPGWNKYKEGAIALQDHGAPVWYRNIRIRHI